MIPPGGAAAIDDLLPQTQCTRCGYPTCRAYAAAMVSGEVSLNRCPPGGDETIAALARALGRAPAPLDPECGTQGPWVVARIVESECIGCTLCIQACPVDAILGAGTLMHTVIAQECTGCELCVDPCPVDCISLEPVGDAGADGFPAGWMTRRAPLARRRSIAREGRLARQRQARAERRRRARASLPGRDADRATKQMAIRGRGGPGPATPREP